MIGKEKTMLPDFPRTQHLPYKANAAKGDRVASSQEAEIIFASDTTVEEKIDGANTGMLLFEGQPIIRNRNHLLNKAFTRRRTPAKMQFASIFGWFYQHMGQFERVNEAVGFPAAIYGEWMYATHGIRYDSLPDLWIAYDIWDWAEGKFVPSVVAREVLQEAGFQVPPLLHTGRVASFEQLEELCNQQSAWTQEQREGVYLKVNAPDRITHRFKMVRPGFSQGAHWNDHTITRNQLA